MASDETTDRLLRVVARLNRWATQHARWEVPYAQARLLALLEEIGPARIGDLAVADHTSQPTMTTQVGRLEQQGWARRDPDPTDGRAAVISLTDAGRGSLAAVRRARSVAVRPVIDALDPDRRAQLEATVAVLEDLLHTAASTSDPQPSAPFSHPAKES